MGSFHTNLLLHGPGEHMKTNNTPLSPKAASPYVWIRRGKAEFGATLTFHSAFVRLTPSNQQPYAQWTCGPVQQRTKAHPCITLVVYHFLCICLSLYSHNTLTSFPASTTQTAVRLSQVWEWTQTGKYELGRCQSPGAGSNKSRRNVIPADQFALWVRVPGRQ